MILCERFKNVIIIITNVIKMLTLLRKGYAKIGQLFYKNKNVKLHLREIARQTKLFEPSAYRFLNYLEKDQVLKSERDGNLKKYSLKKGLRAYFLLEAFDLENFERLPSLRKKAIKIYLDNLSEKPVFAVLFGSTAKGTYREDSDIDILIITNRRIPTTKAEEEADALTGMKMSSFQITYKEFLTECKMKKDKVIQSAIQSGYPLINHIQYYSLLYETEESKNLILS